jgi:hypothetical protein
MIGYLSSKMLVENYQHRSTRSYDQYLDEVEVPRRFSPSKAHNSLAFVSNLLAFQPFPNILTKSLPEFLETAK